MVIQEKDTAQASVIGGMLIDGDLIGPTLAALRPEDFLNETYRRLFLAIRKDFSDGQIPDLVTILDRLRGDGGEAHWAEVMKGCMEITPSTANHKVYIEVVRKEARLQRINELGMALARALTLEGAAETVGRLNEQLVERQGVHAVTMEEALVDFYERMKVNPTYLPWGFAELDSRVYAEPGDFIIIGGRPSAGKTAFALSAAYAQAERYRVGFFSLETNKRKAFDRLVARVAQVRLPSIKHRTLQDGDWKRLASQAEDLSRRELEIVPAAGMTADDIIAYAQARRYDIIYIDYVQIIEGDASHGLVAMNTEISKTLHSRGQATGITIVGLAQLSRPEKTKNKAEPPPRISDLRESGQYEQDADVIMLIYRVNPSDLTDGLRQLDVGKNKEGELGGFELDFDGATQTFTRHKETPGEHYARVHREIAQAAKGEWVPPESRQVTFEELPDDEPTPFDKKTEEDKS